MTFSDFKLLICSLFAASTVSFLFATAAGGQTGVRTHRLSSKVFNNERTIRVLVPPGYESAANRKKHYPVLYLNDGQNLFDASLSPISRMEWRVDETVYDLVARGIIEPIIVVGVDNAGRDRAFEYLPYPDEFYRPPIPDPQGRRYPDLLVGEIMPFIERNYRVRKGRKNTALGGSSYGALISLYTFAKRPQIFGRLLIESPSIYVANAKVLDEVRSAGPLPDKIFIGVGTNEGNRPNCVPGDISKEAVTDVLRLKKLLIEKGLSDRRMKVVIEDCAVHDEAAWAKRLPDSLTFLFRKS